MENLTGGTPPVRYLLCVVPCKLYFPESVVKEIAQRKPLRAVFRDSGFASSPEKINVFEIFKLYMPEDANDITKRVRVI